MKCPIILKHGNVPDNKFNATQLRQGIKVEREHTNKACVAKQIAKAHLLENSKYYSYLQGMEKFMKHNTKRKK